MEREQLDRPEVVNAMESYGLQKRNVLPVSNAGRRMDAALEKLRQAGPMKPSRKNGRLIFGLDLTGSREHSLRHARIATAAMFDVIKAIGAVAVKLVYYRGTDECRESKWYVDPEILSRSMRRLSCETGQTQIARLLRLALAETETISGVVFVGDHCEDDPRVLFELAQTLGRKYIPLFVFHECADHDERSLQAKPIFKRMSELSGGVYVEFKPDSGAVLRELLSSVAALSAGGLEGVERMALPTTSEARQLRGRLLLGDGNRGY
jgi:hypothetical protein